MARQTKRRFLICMVEPERVDAWSSPRSFLSFDQLETLYEQPCCSRIREKCHKKTGVL